MTINSYFYDSVTGDRPYSASNFAEAFNMIMPTGIIPLDETGALGFEIGGTNYNTIFEGRAVIEGRFIEVIDNEILSIPAGSYAGQVAIRVDSEDTRAASIVVKTDQQPTQGVSLFELPLYNVTVANGIITAVSDLRTQGGAIAKTAANVCTWYPDPNGVVIETGFYNGVGKPVKLFLTSAQPAASASAHHVWIQIDNF